MKSWRLKKYLDQQREPQELVEQDLAGSAVAVHAEDGRRAPGPDAQHRAVPRQGDLPAAPITAPAELSGSISRQRRRVGGQGIPVHAGVVHGGRAPGRDAGGRAIAPSIAWGPAVGDIAEISRYTQAAEGLLFQKGGKIQRLAVKDVTKQSTYEGDFLYGGVDDNYFMTVALTPGASKSRISR